VNFLAEKREAGIDSVSLTEIKKRLEKMALDMEKLGIAEYVEMLHRPWRLFIINFWAGLARGFGMAIGFTILGAILVYILQRIVILNMPIIGDFIADMVRIVQAQLNL